MIFLLLLKHLALIFIIDSTVLFNLVLLVNILSIPLGSSIAFYITAGLITLSTLMSYFINQTTDLSFLNYLLPSSTLNYLSYSNFALPESLAAEVYRIPGFDLRITLVFNIVVAAIMLIIFKAYLKDKDMLDSLGGK